MNKACNRLSQHANTGTLFYLYVYDAICQFNFLSKHFKIYNNIARINKSFTKYSTYYVAINELRAT